MSLAMACGAVLAACAGGSATQDVEGLTGGVAATVNGVEIEEDTITRDIQSVREGGGFTDEESWGMWLAQIGYSPETAREEVLETYITQELVRQNAASLGVVVEESAVDASVEATKAQLESEEAWQSALERLGITEEMYRDSIRDALLNRYVAEAFGKTSEPTEEQLDSAASLVSLSFDGAKRSSHILFDAGDAETAQSVLDQLNAGTLEFAAAAEQYSKDTGSAARGGDVGWNKLNSFVPEYTEGLDALEKGQVSGLVTSQFGIHIIMCTDVFEVPEGGATFAQLPEDFAANARERAVQTAQSESQQKWIEECRAAADIVINEMPANVPYNLDIEKYKAALEEANAAAAAEGEDAAAEGEPAAEGEGEGAEADSAEPAGSE